MNLKIKLIIIFLFLLGIQISLSQVKIIINAVPSDTPENGKIYMASSLNQWKPNDDSFLLKKDSSGNYYIEIPNNTGKIEYKFTQGSWDTVEGDADGNEIPNRNFVFDDHIKMIENRILSWSKPLVKTQSLSKNVKILSNQFKIPQLHTTRRIWIYLPDNYTNSSEKYPVVYMEDGQNLFDSSTSFSGEWKVDETMDIFSKEGKTKAIIVGIDNGGTERLNEYSPWKNPKYGGGKGEKYADFIANTLKPYIDKRYRTLPQAKNTGLIGSSMGGLISFYTGLKYPNTFGKLGIFSPSFWFAEKDLKQFMNKNGKSLKNTKFYFLAGTQESEDMACNIKEVVGILNRKGVSPENIKLVLDPEGTHSEKFWAQGFPDAFLWLFSK